MKQQTFILAAVFAAVTAACFATELPYANKALNPVKFAEPARHAEIPLIKDGKPNFVIVRDLRAETGRMPREWKSVTLAVEALQDALMRTTGKQAEVIDANSAEAKNVPVVIALGKSPLTDRLGLKPLELPKEAFVVKSFDRGVVIAGHDGSLIPGAYNKFDWTRYRLNGTLNGTYDFIERVFGIRYYFPGIGIYAPKLTNLNMKPVHYSDEPYFRNRFNWGYNRIAKRWPWKDVKKVNQFDKAWRLAMSTRFNDVCHSPDPHFLLAAWPDRKKTIFFTDSRGVMYYNPATHIGNLMDITNPELAHLLAVSYKKFYDTDGKWRTPWSHNGRSWYPPNSEYVLFGQADTFVRDLISEKNKHLFPESRRNNSAGMLSDLYVNFYCLIGKEMKKILPGKRLGVLAYHNYTLPPIVCRDIPDNIDFQVCMGRIIMAKSEKTRERWRATFKGWYDVLGGRPVSAWTYGTQGTAFTQAIQGRYMKDYINTIRPWLSRDGLFFDASGLNWKFYYSYYSVYRAFWNPDFDADAALDEHWGLLYGPKAGAILKDFYRLLVGRWEQVTVKLMDDAGGRANSDVSPEVLYRAYSIPVIDRLEKMLKEAIAATQPGSLERRRIEFFAEPWQKDFVGARAYCSMMIPTYGIRQLAAGDKITIDGSLDEAVWKAAQPIPMQQAKGHGGKLVSSPCGKMLWNQDGIYVGFTCSGKPMIRNGDVWFGSDNIELFLSPGTEKATYYQFAVSPGNDFSDAYKVEKPMEAALTAKWDCEGLKRAVTVTDNSWTVEMFIPFSGLHHTPAPKPYSLWFGNLVNNKLGPDGKPVEYSAFAITMGRNHNHALWGNFKFLGKGDTGRPGKPADTRDKSSSGTVSAEKVSRNFHRHSKNYGKAVYYELRNKLNNYLIYFQWIRPTAKKPGSVVIGIPEPVFWQNFVSRGFMSLAVNGIGSTTLEPLSFNTFAENGRAGIDVLYNFDGVKMTLRFSMTETSPLLFMEWIRDKNSAESVDTIELSMATYPSYSLPVGGKPDPRYERELRTPVRTVKGPAKDTVWTSFKPEDKYLIMYDARFDYPGTPKAQGPCFLAIDWNGILAGRCWFGKIYCMNFRFTLDPKADHWRFGLWEYKKRLSNQEFFDYFKSNKAAFQLP